MPIMFPLKDIRRPHNALAYFVGVAILYLLLNVLLPANHATERLYHLSSLQYHVLILLVIAPVLFIWFLAFYGYAKIKEYASLIQDTPEGPALTNIANGMMWLAWGLPIPAFISLLVTAIANNHPGFQATATIVSNYANLIIPVVAFSILSSGSRQLVERQKLFISSARTKLLVLLFVVLGAVYCYLVFHNVDTARPADAKNPYYLPSWLFLLTLVIPYLYAWFIGLLAAYELRLISRHAAGVLYRRAFDLMSRGLAITVAASIALQYLGSALPRRDVALSLGYVLVLIYCLLVVIGLGYGLLAYGANKLKKIEEA